MEEMEVSGELHNVADLPKRNEPWYQLHRRLGEPRSQSGGGSEEKEH
jgi:hypothetical protein